MDLHINDTCREIIDKLVSDVENINIMIDKFKNIDNTKLSTLLYLIHNMPTSSMSRFIVSKLLETTLSKLIDGKYVGDIPEWECDIIYPKVDSLNVDHLKIEVKSLEDMFLKCGDTKCLIIKNGRGIGQTIKSLLPTIKKNLFILVEKKPPFSISYVYPQDLMLYMGSKNTAIKLSDIEKDIELINKTGAELNAYVKKEDINFIYKSILDNDFIEPELYDPEKEIIKTFLERF